MTYAERLTLARRLDVRRVAVFIGLARAVLLAHAGLRLPALRGRWTVARSGAVVRAWATKQRPAILTVLLAHGLTLRSLDPTPRSPDPLVYWTPCVPGTRRRKRKR